MKEHKKEIAIQEPILNCYLIQRLKKQYIKEGESKFSQNSFSFGGGYKNGGFSNEAIEHLSKIWRYDYMGAAEFEFGGVPKSLEEILENINRYTKGNFVVSAQGYTKESFLNKDKGEKIENKKTVFYVCNKNYEKSVKEWIKKFAKNESWNSSGTNKYRTKEPVYLNSNILNREFQKENVGWHDITNHFLFFTDEEMFNNFCDLIGI